MARRSLMTVLILLLAMTATMTAAPAAARSPQASDDFWLTFAQRLEPGAFVKITLKDGKSMKGQLVAVASDTLRVNPRTRYPVPLRVVPIADVASIERSNQGMSAGAKVLTGIGVGAAAFLLWCAVVLSQID